MRFLCLVFVIGASLFALGQNAVSQLEHLKQFKVLASAPLNSNLGEVASIKVIADIKTKQVHFIHSKRFKFHYEYCVEVLNYPYSVTIFNETNYGTSNERQFYLGNINYMEASKSYFLDLSVFDQMPEKDVIAFVKLLQAKAYFGKDLKLLLNTERLMANKAIFLKEIPVILPEALYQDQNTQEVSQGACVGKLRIVNDLDSLKNILPTDILVLHGTPSYFPNVKGILLDEFQTPLSHLVILGNNRGIPILAKKDLFSDSSILQLNGSWVAFKVEANQFSLKPSKPDPHSVKIQKLAQLTIDTTIHYLVPVQQFRFAGSSVIGNKAANFGVLEAFKQKGNYATPEAAFAIPFYFYKKHLSQSTETLIQQLLQHPPNNEDSLRLILKNVRNSIKQTPIDTNLIALINTELRKSPYTTFRFRSSTNAEDALGFSGAGLYESKTVDLNDSTRTIEKALKAVWASCWTFEAFQERRFFDLSDENLAMGILVHRSFPTEKVNGVIISKNVYRSNYPGISINAQVGDVSVVEPPEGVKCDQITILHELEYSHFNRSVEYIATSSLTDGTPILSEQELIAIEKAVEVLKKHYWNSQPKLRLYFKTYENFGLDIEFKLEGENRQLYFKQVRIYNVK
jgi:pyruvate, water dikinase